MTTPSQHTGEVSMRNDEQMRVSEVNPFPTSDVPHPDDEKSPEDSVENENLAAIDLSQEVARMNRLKQEYWFVKLRNLVKRCPEFMNASSIMFRVLKDRIVEEREFEQYLA
jgi:hypothetical protein